VSYIVWQESLGVFEPFLCGGGRRFAAPCEKGPKGAYYITLTVFQL
jgi:hypothetical protein